MLIPLRNTIQQYIKEISLEEREQVRQRAVLKCQDRQQASHRPLILRSGFAPAFYTRV